MKHYLTVSFDSPAATAFVMHGDEMEPYIPAGRSVKLAFTLPNQGECGLFTVDGRAYVRQYCEDSFGTVYLLCANRARAELDLHVPPGSGKAVVCLGRVLLEKLPPLPFS